MSWNIKTPGDYINGPLTVTGSATITGDLTVRTNQLVVNSSGSFVGKSTGGVGIDGVQLLASGFSGFSASGTTALFVNRNTSDGTVLQLGRSGASAADFGAIAGGGFTVGLSGSEWMRINSTGLGVGTGPSYKFHVRTTSDGVCQFIGRGGGTTNPNFQVLFTDATATTTINAGSGAGNPILTLATAGSDRLIIDSSGNVGISVQPSAWAATFKPVQIGSGTVSSAFIGQTNSPVARIMTNSYFDGTNFVKVQNNTAGMYVLSNNQHEWHNAATGTGTFSFTQAMTLNASGTLLVGKSAPSLANAGFRVDPTGEVYTSVAANTNGTSTYAVYSTTDLGYKFYVGLAGTVFATNTTISAISDARLKENVQDIDVGLGAILALKPRKFDWKAGKGKDIKGDRGFIAQEFEQVFPNLIDEWKDEAPEGEAPYKSVRQDLIPVLVKAIQELTARVQTLETR